MEDLVLYKKNVKFMENFLDIDLDQAAVQPAPSRQPGPHTSVERPLSRTEYQPHNRSQSRASDRPRTPEATGQKLQVKVEQTSEHDEPEPSKPSEHPQQGMVEPREGREELSRDKESDQRKDTTDEERCNRAEKILMAIIFYQKNKCYSQIEEWTEAYRKLTGIKGHFMPEEELEKLYDTRVERLTQAKQQSTFKSLKEVKAEDLQFDEPDFTTQLGKPLNISFHSAKYGLRQGFGSGSVFFVRIRNRFLR